MSVRAERGERPHRARESNAGRGSNAGSESHADRGSNAGPEGNVRRDRSEASRGQSDEHALERLASRLSLRTPFTLQGLEGGRADRRAGASVEPADVRAYQPGDDVRHLDWRVFMRTGQLWVRPRESESSAAVQLVVDGSRSMGAYPEKERRLRSLCRLMVLTALGERMAASCVLLGGRRERAVGRDALTLLRGCPLEADGASPHEALRRGPPLQSCGLRVFVSDLLFEVAPERTLALLRRGAGRLVVIELLSLEERAPRPHGAARLIDVEGAGALDVGGGDDVRRRYLRRLEAHREAWRDAARRAGAALCAVGPEVALEQAVAGPLAPLFATRSKGSGRGQGGGLR